MTEKRFKVAVYDENAINGFAVLDLHKPNISKRLKYENVYIGSKEGCEIVCKFGNGLADENEQLKIKLENVEDARKSYKEDWKACTAYCDEYKNEISDLRDNINGLLEENEQLKQQIKVLENTIDGLTGTIAHFDLDEVMLND